MLERDQNSTIQRRGENARPRPNWSLEAKRGEREPDRSASTPTRRSPERQQQHSRWRRRIQAADRRKARKPPPPPRGLSASSRVLHQGCGHSTKLMSMRLWRGLKVLFRMHWIL